MSLYKTFIASNMNANSLNDNQLFQKLECLPMAQRETEQSD